MAPLFIKKTSPIWLWWVLADLLIFLVLALVAWRYFPVQRQVAYQIDLSLKILHGQVPYVNFTVEYPPLALLSYLLPALFFRATMSYYVAFVIELLLFDLVTLALITGATRRLGISTAQAMLVHALVILGVGPIIVASYDIMPAAMTLAAFYFFIIGKNKTAWASVALGLMTKLYPVVVAPFFGLYYLRHRQYRRLAEGTITFVIVGLALSLPWLLINANGFLYFLTFHLERGLHAETVFGSVLLVGKILGLVNVQGIYNFGSFNLFSPLADRLAGLSLIVMAGLLGGVYLLYTRAIFKAPAGLAAPAGSLPETAAILLIKYLAAAVFMVLLAGKVFSMQYLVWLCPLLPLLTGRWRVPLLACFLVAGAFSQFTYPYYYAQFEHYAPPLVVMMFVRNVLLIASAAFILLPGKQPPKKETEPV